jgi:serine/threonine protein kinase
MSATIQIDRTREAWGFEEGDAIADDLTALRLLGGGTRYEAYLAFDARLHHVVVVKVLRPDRREEGGALGGLRGEADVLRSVNHPAIARLLGEDLEGERPFIELEFVEGPRLSTLIRRFGPLETEQAAPLAVEVASALHYLHGSGLVHLDVKPKNLIMGAPPRLIDLSIARSVEAAGMIERPIGTDAYMAPEQCRPAPNRIGPPADVWGLGVTMHEALTGQPVFAAGGERADAADGPLEASYPQLVDRPAPLPTTVPRELRVPVEAALAPDPQDRPTAREMAEAVEPLLRRPRRLRLNQLKPR